MNKKLNSLAVSLLLASVSPAVAQIGPQPDPTDPTPEVMTREEAIKRIDQAIVDARLKQEEKASHRAKKKIVAAEPVQPEPPPVQVPQVAEKSKVDLDPNAVRDLDPKANDLGNARGFNEQAPPGM